eukprot:8521823-Pyramimonas_sp.AAC.2
MRETSAEARAAPNALNGPSRALKGQGMIIELRQYPRHCTCLHLKTENDGRKLQPNCNLGQDRILDAVVERLQ